MRIYCVADIHGLPERLALIKANIDRLQPDALVIAGDVTAFSSARPVVSELARLPVRVLAVRGNSDLRRVDRLLDEHPTTESIHLKRIQIDGVDFVGLSGALVLPFGCRAAVLQKTRLERIGALLDEAALSVFVAHPPPRGVLDKGPGRFHLGCAGIRDLILKKQPDVMVCGHIHEAAGADFLGRTLVVNCSIGCGGNGVLLEIERGEPLTVRTP
jgi:hypothetical protein